jgi:hypothetical protein
VFATARGKLIVGRMRHAVRQREAARMDIRGFFRDTLGYEDIDLSRGDHADQVTRVIGDRLQQGGFDLGRTIGAGHASIVKLNLPIR